MYSPEPRQFNYRDMPEDIAFRSYENEIRDLDMRKAQTMRKEEVNSPGCRAERGV